MFPVWSMYCTQRLCESLKLSVGLMFIYLAHTCSADDSSLLACYAMLYGQQLPTLFKRVVLSPTRRSSTRREMKELQSFETPGTTSTKQIHHILKDLNPKHHHCENLKSHKSTTEKATQPQSYSLLKA